jgi:hypothetical protein
MTTFSDALDTHFPGAIPSRVFVEQTARELMGRAYGSENALACLFVCRDEIVRPFVDLVHSRWGHAFDFAALAGMVTAGKTGLHAAFSHAPISMGRRRCVFFALPHVAIDEAGTVGCTQRRGHFATSSACGALCKMRKEWEEGTLRTDFDPDDPEQSIVRQRVLRQVYGYQANIVERRDAPDIVRLTSMVHDAIVADLERSIAASMDPTRDDYSVLSGVLVHGPGGADHVWPRLGYLVEKGKREDVLGV